MVAFDDHPDRGGYVSGDLPPGEVLIAEEHLKGCAECREEVESLRELQRALNEVPPEVLLDGPPDGGDLLLERALRRVRAESSRRRSARTGGVAAAAVVVATLALGSGVLLGRSTAGDPSTSVLPTPSSARPTASVSSETRYASVTDPITGARLTVGVEPAVGWVRVTVAVAGIPEGEPCRLLVLGRDGEREIAGSWLVSRKGAAEGTTLHGAALVPPEDVVAVAVENTGGRRFVTATV